jgi:hypothetical protein
MAFGLAVDWHGVRLDAGHWRTGSRGSSASPLWFELFAFADLAVG